MSSRDYLPIARDYETQVLAGTIPACKWVRLACERNRRDLARVGTPEFPYEFSEALASKICLAAENLPHVKGPKAQVLGRDEDDRPIWATLKLEPWEVWLLTTIFGWAKAGTLLRRFRVALVLVPRKNGKSMLGAVIALYLLTADGESGAQVVSAATTRDQAKIVAELAWEMASRSPGFREYFGVRLGSRTTRSLSVPAVAGTFGPLSADANSLDGLNISGAVIDELHAHKNRDVWDVLDTATGARDQPILTPITTAGVEIGGICHEQMTYLHKLLEQTLADEEYFGVNYTIDEGDAWDEEATWRKANPNFGVSVNPGDLAAKARKARHSPSAVNNFLTKHLNVWVADDAPWMPMDAWRRCADAALVPRRDGALPLNLFEGAVVRISVDLAEVRDIAAVVAVGWCPDGIVRQTGRFYLPEDTVAQSPIAQMQGWVRDGQLIATDGNIADYQRIEDDIAEWVEQLHARYVLFDRALAAQMMQALQKRLGDEDNQKQLVQTCPQTVEVMNPAMAELLRLVLGGPDKFRHDGNPAMTWMMSNVVAHPNYKSELYPRKSAGKDSPYKIDGPVALLMAIGMSQRDEPVQKPSPFTTSGGYIVRADGIHQALPPPPPGDSA